MMELGACVCTVHQPPACEVCPINLHCQAYGDVQQYLSHGGELTQTDAPVVSQYPAKVSVMHVLCLLSIAGFDKRMYAWFKRQHLLYKTKWIARRHLRQNAALQAEIPSELSCRASGEPCLTTNDLSALLACRRNADYGLMSAHRLSKLRGARKTLQSVLCSCCQYVVMQAMIASTF